MSKVQTLKSVIKKGSSEKPSFGTNPWDPWSTKANIAEDAMLDQYLVSRGMNPKHVSKDQKVAHSKMGQFLKWKRDRMSEAVDRKDTITFDIPLLIRVLEFAREDLKTDVLLHKMVERLISIRGRGTLTMDQYGKIIKEEAEALGESLDADIISEISSETLQRYKDKAMKSADELASKGQYEKSNNRLLNHMKATGKQIDKTTAGIKKSLNREETVVEVAPPGFEGTVKAMKKHKDIDNPWALAWSMKNKGYKSHKKADGTPKNENYQDPMAASSMPGDCANSPDDVEPKNKNKKLIQMSKSARIIKSIYKKKGMKEETYDHEKEDKSVASPGKKPKMQQVNTGLEEPQAAAVMSGGTTMTGEKRDTIEIDPMMKMRKPISGKR